MQIRRLCVARSEGAPPKCRIQSDISFGNANNMQFLPDKAPRPITCCWPFSAALLLSYPDPALRSTIDFRSAASPQLEGQNHRSYERSV